MDDRTRIRLGRTLSGAAIIGAAISVTLLLLIGQWGFLVEEFGLHNVVAAIGLGLIGWVALSTQPRNGAVWALVWSAFFGMLQPVGVAAVALYERADPDLFLPTSSPSEWPLGAAIANQTVSWTWIPSLFILLTIWLLLYPDGKPLSPRWRWMGWFSAALITVSSLAFAWASRPSSTQTFDDESLDGLIVFGLLALLLLLPTSLVSASSLIVRYRRSTGIAGGRGEDEGALTFMIHGARSGAGLAAVADRVDALGGTLSVESTHDGEAVVTGRLPATALEPA